MPFINIIPREINPEDKMAHSDFTRKNKLTFAKLIIFILSIVASGKSKGVDSKSGEFFKDARRSGLWPDAKAIHRSTVTKARNKVTWKIFENIFHDAVKPAYELWPCDAKYLWNGMSVFAFDPQAAARIFTEILEEIARVKYYRPKEPRPSQPRVTKKANNKWCKGKVKMSRSP